MPIRLLCTNPDCAQELEFEDNRAGTHATCLNCGAQIRVPSAGEMVGRQLGNYHILELLGKGSAGKSSSSCKGKGKGKGERKSQGKGARCEGSGEGI